MSLEQFSRGNTFDYEITVAENIDAEAVYLPSMILQPFVENAIIHGVAHLEKRGNIKVYELKDARPLGVFRGVKMSPDRLPNKVTWQSTGGASSRLPCTKQIQIAIFFRYFM
mgnify:CR=1 FL=1